MKTVLLAAGFGSRLWPLSTPEKPKQFQQLLGKESLLQYTYNLFRKMTAKHDMFVVTFTGLEHWVYEQLPALPRANVLLVPERRNTLPHTLFALKAITDDPKETVLFSSTDTAFSSVSGFQKALVKCQKNSDFETITLLLSKDGAADTNAGYARLDDQGKVAAFMEKPDQTTLTNLMKTGDWHKNIFTYAASTAAIETALDACQDRQLARLARTFLHTGAKNAKKAFLALPFCDISSNLLQNAPNVAGCLADTDCFDLGTFRTLHQLMSKDDYGNASAGNVIIQPDCKNNLVINHFEQPLVIFGINNHVIVQTPHGSVCSPLQQADGIGEIYKHEICKLPRFYSSKNPGKQG